MASFHHVYYIVVNFLPGYFILYSIRYQEP
jgi:hypothetical protein